MADDDDMGFGAVLAGEKWVEPPPPEQQTTCAPEPPRIDTNRGTTYREPVTAAVTKGLTEDGVQAAKALVHLPEMEPMALAQLARAIAMDVLERHTILKKFNLTQVQYDFLAAHNAFFKAALEAACLEWHAPLSTSERLKVEAAAILEDTLPGLGARMQNRAEGLPGVIEAAKLFAKVAGVGEREAGTGAVGERFTINIDLGGDQKITVSTAPQAPGLALADSAGAIQSDP